MLDRSCGLRHGLCPFLREQVSAVLDRSCGLRLSLRAILGSSLVSAVLDRSCGLRHCQKRHQSEKGISRVGPLLRTETAIEVPSPCVLSISRVGPLLRTETLNFVFVTITHSISRVGPLLRTETAALIHRRHPSSISRVGPLLRTETFFARPSALPVLRPVSAVLDRSCGLGPRYRTRRPRTRGLVPIEISPLLAAAAGRDKHR